MTKQISILLAAVLVFVASACVPSFRKAGEMTYAEIPYTSVEGEPWPVKELELPEIAERYAMKTTPTIRYVELNPEGAQTLVFIHGLGSYLKFWRYQLDAFADAGYRVIALDMIGYGKSDKPASFPYTMEAMGDVVLALIDRLNVTKPILVGHSMGGQTALSFAIRYPDRARGLVLTAPAGFEEFTRRERDWFESVFTVAFIKSADETAIWGSVRHGNFYQWQDEYVWLIEERVRLAQTEEFSQYAYANVKSVHGLADNRFVRGHLDRIEVPALIIHGDMDRLIPNPFLHGGYTADVMKYGAERIPRATRKMLAKCGHTIQMDCHDRYNAEVMAYLEATFPDPPPPGPEPARKESAEVGRITVYSKPVGEVLVDGEPTGMMTPGEVVVDPGRHEIQVKFGEGELSGVKVVKMRAGTRAKLFFRQQAPPESSPATPPESTPAGDAEAAEAEEGVEEAKE